MRPKESACEWRLSNARQSNSLRSELMKARLCLCGLTIALVSFVAGLLANGFVLAQAKESPSEWKYKVVELALQTPGDGSKSLSALSIEEAFDVGKVQK